MKKALLVAIMGLLVGSSTAEAQIKIPIPKGMPVALAIEAIKGFAIGNGVANGPSRVNQAGTATISIVDRIPVDVSVSRTHYKTLFGERVASTDVRVQLDVKCQVIVSYDVDKIGQKGDSLELPKPKIFVSYLDDRGMRGKYFYEIDPLRYYLDNGTDDTINRLKSDLYDHALEKAKKEFLDSSKQNDSKQRIENQLTATVLQQWEQHLASLRTGEQVSSTTPATNATVSFPAMLVVILIVLIAAMLIVGLGICFGFWIFFRKGAQPNV